MDNKEQNLPTTKLSNKLLTSLSRQTIDDSIYETEYNEDLNKHTKKLVENRTKDFIRYTCKHSEAVSLAYQALKKLTKEAIKEKLARLSMVKRFANSDPKQVAIILEDMATDLQDYGGEVIQEAIDDLRKTDPSPFFPPPAVLYKRAKDIQKAYEDLRDRAHLELNKKPKETAIIDFDKIRHNEWKAEGEALGIILKERNWQWKIGIPEDVFKGAALENETSLVIYGDILPTEEQHKKLQDIAYYQFGLEKIDFRIAKFMNPVFDANNPEFKYDLMYQIKKRQRKFSQYREPAPWLYAELKDLMWNPKI